MLIARAPLRVSLAGGGTDLPAYYEQHGGAVLSTTIDKYFYVFLSPSDGHHVQVTSSDYRTFYRKRLDEPSLWDGVLNLPKAVIDHFGTRTGLSVFLASQAPPGTGLGSSSAVAVALIKAMSVLSGEKLSPHQIAELACVIEIDQLGMPIGKQDQYAAAFGGLNFFRFTQDGVEAERIDPGPEVMAALDRRLMLFFTGMWHDSGEILKEQSNNSHSAAVESLDQIKAIATAMRDDLCRGDLSRIGGRLHESWLAKRGLATGITLPQIDRWYNLARSAGASGGKIAGAGGGGFLLLYCEPEYQERVTEVLGEEGLVQMDFSFESGGALVIMNNLVGEPLPAWSLVG
jgi:D-glycero-alpha-D-manno-heptose-7-phosphate kinase